MKYYSTNGQASLASFQEAVFKGLPEDNGLYMPENIPSLPSSFLNSLNQLSLQEIAFKVMEPFVGKEIPDHALMRILEESLSFDIPLEKVDDQVFSLELFHGPTFAFKDVGARFLARTLSHFSQKNSQQLTVLVATSGDTGSAVAQGFYEVPNINVVILYPSGKISHFQEQQMTTLGKNITALEVDGVFDDCQRMVKQAFLDNELNKHVNLTSANSINIARMLPQSIYYFYAFSQLPAELQQEVIVSVPSGNYGNLTAGLIAKQMGLPIHHFLACSNINDTVPKYLQTGNYKAKKSKPTISNAMDVGDPSNFVRMLDLNENSHEKMNSLISGFSFSDQETRAAIREVYQSHGYILDPHGAIGWLGLNKYLTSSKKTKATGTGVFLETAHPYKFKSTVENEIDKTIDPVLTFDSQSKKSIALKNNFQALKEFLITDKQ